MSNPIEAMVVIGRSYPEGNLKGQRGEKITIPTNPRIDFVHIVRGERTPMECDLRTGKNYILHYPQS